ncbi:MAG TPA: glycogen debranching N-terminal domain-containing protein [Chloroflexia bacterium]|nr:glycogen debranching N-terminal domain-containing protein [Chloroflexia bacterium]
MSNRLVLKENLVFMVSAEDGDIPQDNSEGWGIYYKDTRYLSILEIRINGYTPVLLTSSGEFNFMGNIQSANPLMQVPAPEGYNDSSPSNISNINNNGNGNGDSGMVTLLPRTLSVRRNRFIEDGMHERLGFFNYNSFPLSVSLTMRFGSDFRDMFDVRGYKRPKRGQIRTPEWDGERLTFCYLGLDNQERRTEVAFDVKPSKVNLHDPNSEGIPALERRNVLPESTYSVVTPVVQPAVADVVFDLLLEPGQPFAITYHIIPQGLGNGQAVLPTTFDMGARRMRLAYESWFKECTGISSDNEVFDKFLQRSIYDLRILTEELPTGLLPVAGIPWFAVPFGRDSLITAMQTLIFDPQISVGTLRYLARFQGQKVNDWNEEEPGKILHEVRAGEMTVLHEMPHVPYYGSVDSTPLFLMLFAQTMRWLNSEELYKELLPNIKAALNWIDNYADKDGDGFIEYHCHNDRGVKNQGWKDNAFSLLFRDGSFPEPPIALCEAQAYVYAAKMWVAEVVERYNEKEWAARLRQEAAELKQKFNEKFWIPEEKFYAQALDRDKKVIPVVTSNPGHCLWCGIVDEDKAGFLAEHFMTDDMSSGWGIRTVSSNEPTFNPMSYHNGSVWPHDNSIIASGLKLYGYHSESNSVISQIFAASQRFRYYRLPEVFCGFQQDNRYYSSPAEYPVSCSPQAWTAGAAIYFLQTMLGLEVDAARNHVVINPHLPSWLNELTLLNLLVGDNKASFRVTRDLNDPTQYRLEVLEKPGALNIQLQVQPGD